MAWSLNLNDPIVATFRLTQGIYRPLDLFTFHQPMLGLKKVGFLDMMQVHDSHGFACARAVVCSFSLNSAPRMMTVV
jgi:hypothetical protein